MLGLAWFVYQQSKLPLEPFAIGAICSCVSIGAILAVLPFVLEYRMVLRLAESENLTRVVDQVQNLEDIAAQIGLATSQWQTVNDHSTKAVAAATQIGEKMSAEARAFGEFMQKATDAEKSNLRLEVDKLRRSEADWLQVLVRMLDHTFALHTAAVRSGKTSLIEQLTQFQTAQRDVARRVGLTPFIGTPGEAFDSQKHQASGGGNPESDARVEETIAPGYTFRGQQIRHALVSIQTEAAQGTSELASNKESTESASQPQEQTLL